MPKILIISPDPETLRILELAFELEGAEVSSAVDARALGTPKAADIVLIDMVRDTKEEWASVRLNLTKLKREKVRKGPKIVLILPRGFSERKLPKDIGRPDALFGKPYELIDMVRSVVALNTPKTSSSSRRRIRRSS